MKKSFRSLLQKELDADSITGVYAMCGIWLLELFRILFKQNGLGFWPITVIIILSWLVAWAQKLLFLCPLPESRFVSVVRELLWFLIPVIAFHLCTWRLDWLSGCPDWSLWIFSLTWGVVLICWRLCIYLILRDETTEWNSMLTQFKQKEKEVTDHE